MTKKAENTARPERTNPGGNGEIEKKKKKKNNKVTVAPPEFASYILKLHKAQQSESGEARTISKDAVMAFEGMADHMVNLLVENGKRVSRFTKSKTFKMEEAKAATTLSLPGALRTLAMNAGQAAYDNYKATLPAKAPKKVTASTN